MRPEILFKAFAPNTNLQGIGPRIGKLLEKHVGPRIIDLIWLFPNNIVERKYYSTLNDIPNGTFGTILAHVVKHKPPRNRRQPYSITCSVENETVELVFFNARADYLKNVLPPEEMRVVSGKIEYFKGRYQITHPDYIVQKHLLKTVCGTEPVYPLTQNLSNKLVRRSIENALELLPKLPEWLDPLLLAREDWQDWSTCQRSIHAPKGIEDLSLQSKMRRRLAYDELLANQLALALIRNQQRETDGQVIKGTGEFVEKAVQCLSFNLTSNQNNIFSEIKSDLSSRNRMLRLLQGDVGSGKTIVAFLSMIYAFEAGFQSALMAPTEILARQHFDTLSPLAEKIGIKIGLLTGKDKVGHKRDILSKLSSGELNLIIGTHALFQEDIRFKKLGYAVVDEQHKFGVHQRLALSDKGIGIDILVMTATPIPRTLTMTAYGDLDVSNLVETLPGRRPVNTKAIPSTRIDEVIYAIGRAIKKGARAYWICPLIESSETNNVVTTQERFAILRSIFGDRVGCIHGRMKTPEKDKIMEEFRRGVTDILVATTVVEVGVDVPEATIIVIEHAERFGLAQLHQLRGRVGRGTADSTCLLVYRTPLGDTARARLTILRETNDGFHIAEEDLRLRGSGELLGTRQSGTPTMRVADLDAHSDLLHVAKNDADSIFAHDPHLQSGRGQALRILLYLFERDIAVQYLKSG